MKKLLKVLNHDLTSPFQDFRYDLSVSYTCVNFDEDISNSCSNGFDKKTSFRNPIK